MSKADEIHNRHDNVYVAYANMRDHAKELEAIVSGSSLTQYLSEVAALDNKNKELEAENARLTKLIENSIPRIANPHDVTMTHEYYDQLMDELVRLREED